MYRLLHRLFRWDYVYWRNSADTGIARIHVDGELRPYYWRHKTIIIIDRMDPLPPTTSVVWFTCHPTKYGLKP